MAVPKEGARKIVQNRRFSRPTKLVGSDRKNRDFHDFFVFCGRLRPALCCRAAAVRRRILNGCQKKTFEEVNRTFFQVPENPENYGPLKETLGVPGTRKTF